MEKLRKEGNTQFYRRLHKNKTDIFYLLFAFLVIYLALAQAAVSPLRAAVPADLPSDLNSRASQAAAYLLAQEKKGELLSPWSCLALVSCGKGQEILKRNEICKAQLAKYRASGELNDLSLMVLTLLACGENPYNWQGYNFVEELRATQLPDGKFPDRVDGKGLGSNGEQVLINAHIWAIIALQAAGAAPPHTEAALQWLLDRQLDSGGFHWYAGEKGPDVDSTAMALMALAALGEKADSPAVKKALLYLKSAQLEDGGFSSWGAPSAESCSMVISALVSLGLDPCGKEWSLPGEKNPLTALLSFQLPDGSFEHIRDSRANLMATEQALRSMGDVISGRTVFARLQERWQEQLQDRLGEKNLATVGLAGVGGQKSQESRIIRFWVGRGYYEIEENGWKQTVDMTDAVPFINQGRTFVPVRYLAAALGVPPEGIMWSENPVKVELLCSGTRVSLREGVKELLINGAKTVPMDVFPLLLPPGRFYLPARYVATAFGYEVDWVGEEQMVVVYR